MLWLSCDFVCFQLTTRISTSPECGSGEEDGSCAFSWPWASVSTPHTLVPRANCHDKPLLYVQVITISGRTIRKQAQASPEYAEAAIECISRLLAACPQEDLDRAQQMRKARMNVKAV